MCGLLSCTSALFAQTAKEPALRPVLLSNSLQAASAYHKVSDSLITHVKQFSEVNFLTRHKRLFFAYERQWSATEAFSAQAPEAAPRLVRKAWKALETGTYGEALQLLNPVLNAKKVSRKQAPVYRFFLSLAHAAADYERGSEKGWKFLESGYATTEDSLLYADCLIGYFAFDEAMTVQDLIEQAHPTDTLMQARMRYLRGKTLRARLDTLRAVPPLIESAYLLQVLRPSPERDSLLRHVCLEMAVLYANRNDFDNALRNAREALALSRSAEERAAAQLGLGSVYRRAGAMPDAEKFLDSAYQGYRVLYGGNPERYGQAFSEAIGCYAEVQRWYDRNSPYQQLLEEKVAVLRFLSRYGFFTHRMALAQTYFDLGHKFMNIDVKIGPAEQCWQKADTLLRELVREDLVWAGDLYVDNNYKLAGCKSAFNKAAEAKVFFVRSLEVRRRLYATAPKTFGHDLATVLIQNANFDANEKKYQEAIDKMTEAEAMLKESNDDRGLQEATNFKNFLKNKLKK